MRRVYIVNEGGHDYSAAREYGELIPLSQGKVNSSQVSRVYREFADILRNSNGEDYLLISGLSTLNAVAAAILARKHGRINILQFMADTKSYREREIIIDNLIGEIAAPLKLNSNSESSNSDGSLEEK